MRIEAARLAMDLCVLDTAINAVSAGFRCLGLSSQLQVQIAMICGFRTVEVLSGICHAKIVCRHETTLLHRTALAIRAMPWISFSQAHSHGHGCFPRNSPPEYGKGGLWILITF